MKASYFVFIVAGVFVVTSEEISVMVGDSVTLNTDVNLHKHDTVLWYFNDIRIALINGEASKSCLFDGEGGIFRDRLEVNFETGSLTITNTKYEHIGRYEAEIIRSESSGKRQSLNRNKKCDSTKITRKSINIGGTIKTFSVIISAKNDEKSQEIPAEEDKGEKYSGLSAGVVAGIVVAVFIAVALLVSVAAVTGMNQIRFWTPKKDMQGINEPVRK